MLAIIFTPRCAARRWRLVMVIWRAKPWRLRLRDCAIRIHYPNQFAMMRQLLNHDIRDNLGG
jgi:hypothetical protein